MWNGKTQLERDEDALAEEYDNGGISLQEYNRQIRELHRDYRRYAQEAAEEAYEREMERFY